MSWTWFITIQVESTLINGQCQDLEECDPKESESITGQFSTPSSSSQPVQFWKIPATVLVLKLGTSSSFFQDLSMTSRDRTRGSESTQSRIHAVLTTLSLVISFIVTVLTFCLTGLILFSMRLWLTPIFEADVTLNACVAMGELHYGHSSLHELAPW